jgi:hypothetical protein
MPDGLNRLAWMRKNPPVIDIPSKFDVPPVSKPSDEVVAAISQSGNVTYFGAQHLTPPLKVFIV